MTRASPRAAHASRIESATNFAPADAVAAGRSARSGHRVGREKDFAGRLGAEEILERKRRKMDAVRNQAGRQFVAREQALDDVVVAREGDRRAVANMSTHRRA